MKRQVRPEAATGEAGLSLIEVMVALLMMSIVSISAAVVLVGGLRTTTEQSVNQRGVAVATRALETLSSIPVPELVSGRSQTSVQALLAEPAIAALTGQDLPGPQLDAETGLGTYDPAADATSRPVVPLRDTEQLDGVAYDVRTVINQCFLHVDTSTTPARKVCDKVAGADGRRIYRATVNVTWGGSSCGRRCNYSVSSLIDQRVDPIFQLAQSVPLLQGITPSSSAITATRAIVISGANFQNGAKLELAAGGGTLADVTQATSTATSRIDATWTAGVAVGAYTLTVVNPDGGRADFQLAVTAPLAVDDCTNTAYGTDPNGRPFYVVFFTANDEPSSGATPTFGSVSVNGSTFSGTAPDGRRYAGIVPNANGTYTIDYTIKVGGLTSNSARMTFKVNAGSC